MFPAGHKINTAVNTTKALVNVLGRSPPEWDFSQE
jgi:hypothetical protein